MSEETNELDDGVKNIPQEEPVETIVVNDMSEQDLKQLAMDIVDGKVFGSWNVHNPQDLGLAFMILLLMQQKLPDNVGHVYEYISEAGPRSVNGMPCFLSCRFMTKDDAVKLQPMIEQLKQMKQDFLEQSDIKEEACQQDPSSETSTSLNASSDTSTT